LMAEISAGAFISGAPAHAPIANVPANANNEEIVRIFTADPP
jgi:hypothetical protein